MLALFLAASIPMAPAEPQVYYLEMTIHHGDPLAAPGDKNLKTLCRPGVALRSNESVTVSVGLTKDDAPISMTTTVTPVDQHSATLKSKMKVQINGKAMEKEAELQMTSGKPVNVRIGSISAEEQVWATVMLVQFQPGPKHTIHWSNEILVSPESKVPATMPQPMK